MIYELSAKEILDFISNGKSIGSGVYGWVYEYDDKTLIKIYYKDIFRFFLSKNIEELDKEIEINLFVENEMKEIYDGYVTKLERLVSIINWLKSADCFLINGIAVYKGYPIGIFLNYYKGYSKLGDVFFELDGEKK